MQTVVTDKSHPLAALLERGHPVRILRILTAAPARQSPLEAHAPNILGFCTDPLDVSSRYGWSWAFFFSFWEQSTEAGLLKQLKLR